MKISMDLICERIPDSVRIITQNQTVFMNRQGAVFTHHDVELEFILQEKILDIMLQSKGMPISFFMIRWNGNLKHNLRFMGDAFERAYGNLEWRRFDPQRIMPWYFLASDEIDSKGYGVKVRPNAMCFWRCDTDGITLILDVRNGTQGVILDGRRLKLATVLERSSESGQSVFQFAKSFCQELSDRPIFPKFPVYGSNNWYYAYGKSSARQILKDSELLKEMTEGLKNRPYMVIDDGWQEYAAKKGAAGRPYNKGNAKFPDMRQLAEDMRARDIHPGIWLRPLETNESITPEVFRMQTNNNYLDPSVPEALELIGEDIKRMVSWGYELIKHDFTNHDFCRGFYETPDTWLTKHGWSLRNRNITSAECLKNLYRKIYESAGEAVIIGCNVIGHLASGYIHLHRSGDDTSGINYDRSIKMGVNAVAYRLMQHKAFYDIDGDCVGITENIEWDYNKNFMHFLAHSGSPLFISADPDYLTKVQKDEIKQAFTIASQQKDIMEPLDWMDTTVPQRYLINEKEERYRWMRSYGLEKLVIES